MVFCTRCIRLLTNYDISTTIDAINVRGVEVVYPETIAYCPNCKSEIYVPEINDLNVDRREAAYREALKGE